MPVGPFETKVFEQDRHHSTYKLGMTAQRRKRKNI